MRIETSGTERSRLHREHDQLARVTRIDTLGNATTLHARRDYLHNNANQRTSITEENGRKWSFDYDSLGQVIQAEKFESGSEEVLPGYAFGYTFDDIGNRTQTVFNERSAAYTSDALNQYTQRDYPGAVDVRGHAPEHVGVIVNSESTERAEGDFHAPATGDNSAGPIELDIVVKAVDPGPPELLAEESRSAILPQDPENFTYDLDGNLTQDGLWTYEWDAENRLVAMESRTDLPASVTRQRLEFAYDSRSRRIQKTVKEYDSGTSSWATTAQIKFLYDGWNLLAEYDALNSDSLIRWHVWGLDLSGTPQGVGGVGGLLWSSQSGTAYAPGIDGNGNVIAWIDLADGTLAGAADYGAFGETLTLDGSSAEMPFGFSTKYEDVETGLLYYGFRYYSPNAGRWLGRDKIEESGGINLFAMLDNDSVNGIDYLGMGQALSWRLFAHWLGGSGTPVKLNWADFDDLGTAKRAMRDEWVLLNMSTLKNLCKNAPDGHSHVNGPVGSRASNGETFSNHATPFISGWNAYAWNHDSGVTINHNCEKKECTMDFGLNLRAYDDADFNPGDSFGPGGFIQDDWLIKVRDDVPGIGADFRIYALDYVKASQTVGY